MAINLSKSLAKIDKLELRIKHEKTASKSHEKKIKSLEDDIITESAYQKYVKTLQRLPNSNEKSINELREKLNIPPTQVLQTPELTEVESDKDHVQQRVLYLHSQINSLKQENKALLEKLNQAPALIDQLAALCGENTKLST